MPARSLFAAIAVCLAGLTPGFAESAAPAPLGIEQIMARDWIGTPPEEPYWADDGKSIYYRQRRAGSEVVDLHRVEVASGRDVIVSAAELGQADAPGGAWSRDRRLKAFVREGDLYVRESGRRSPRQLTRTGEQESAPQVLATGDRVAFRRGDSFHAIDLATGLDSTLADLRLAKDPEATPDRSAFLAAQQLRLFEVLAARERRADDKRQADRAARAADPTRTPAPFYLGEGKAILRADLSPTGTHLLVALGAAHPEAQGDAAGAEGGKEDSMPVFITESGYVETKRIRPKVGTGSSETPTLLLLDLARHTQVALDLSSLPGLTEDPLAELRQAAEAAKSVAAEAAKAAATARSMSASASAAMVTPASMPPKPRPLGLGEVAWNDDGSRVAVQLFSVDNKDRWIAIAAPGAATIQMLLHESDPAWLGWRFTDFGWMKDGRELWFLSESSGYSHLYLQAPGGARRALTQGPFEVDRPLLARDGKSFFLSANRNAPGNYEAYRVRVDSPELEPLTASGGMTYAVPSPDEKQLLLTSSWTTRPPELFAQAARAGAVPKALTMTTTPAFAAVAWSAPEIVRIPSTHFAGTLQARVYSPPGRTPDTKSPAVVFIHGAGYLQNAHQGWSGYYREFMFHTVLTRAGYVVLDLDYRASAGYGRDFRTAIYRQMGEPELDDLADGVAWMVANRAVDAQRVGTYGGSYGGFLTMMALFKRPELFAAGAALRPVTDWAHYNQSYTSAILNTPEVDPEAYRKSSPIEFAAGLARPLLICHGMVDDNVAFQDSVRLVQRLIELGKTDLFETAIYPFEPHAFTESTSWVDEYKRIFRLFETHLK
ncbi:MAG: prolyl oligopeptidase family serine peptidase [Thermoanaerobaculia bacterium]